ncbi:MAG: homoserine kinase [Desulfurococcaceae archaeon]
MIVGEIVVRAPASIANLGPGFDVLAVAIEGLYDQVKVRITEGSGRVHVAVEDSETVPEGPGNVAYHVAKRFLEYYSIDGLDIHIKVSKGIPPNCGLGSSGASSIATAYALAQLLRRNTSELEILMIAAEGEAFTAGEPHYDNIAASLFGGVVLIDLVNLRVHRIKSSLPVYIGILTPRNITTTSKKTEAARSVIPRAIDLSNYVKQISVVAKLIYALMTDNMELLGESISTDFVVEPHRSKLIPYYYELKELALKHGALGFNISGAGPSVFFMHRSRFEASIVAEKLRSFLEERGISSDTFVTKVRERGVEVVEN